MASLVVNDHERKIGHMIPGDDLDHGEPPMAATSAERMAATRARRRAGLVQFLVTLPIAEMDEIVRLGYEGVAAARGRPARRYASSSATPSRAWTPSRGKGATGCTLGRCAATQSSGK
jgi:hypothetical protein